MKGKINSSTVGVGEAVNVMVGTGEGVIVSMMTAGARSVGEGKEGDRGWHAAILMKTSEAQSKAAVQMNRRVHCFIRRLYQI